MEKKIEATMVVSREANQLTGTMWIRSYYKDLR